MTFDSISTWWWPYVFIVLAGWLATDVFRFLGVFFGGRLSETSEVLVIVRAVATALVAAVVGNLVFHPAGALENVPVTLRAGAFGAGFVVYLLTGKNVLAGIFCAEAALLGGIYLTG